MKIFNLLFNERKQLNFPQIKFYPVLMSLFLVVAGHTGSVLAALGDLPDSPLFVTNSAAANVFFEVDDSGSMDYDILTKEHWQACAYRSGTNTCGFLVQDGKYYGPAGNDINTNTINYSQFRYLTNVSDNAYSIFVNCNYSNVVGVIELCSSDIQQYDWRVKSSSLNVMYYNPEITYLPWNIGDGTSMSDASFTAALSNPQTAIPSRDLTGFVFNVWTDSHGFSNATGGPTSGTSNQSLGSNLIVDWWDNHRSYTVGASSMTVRDVTATAAGETPSSPSALSGGLKGRTLAQEKKNIANWYQYHRRRSFVTKAAISKVIDDNSDYRYGLNFINGTSFPYAGSNTSFVEMPSTDHGTTTHNTALIQGLFDLNWPSASTPLRRGLERSGEYYDNTDGRTDPIIEQCQQNYTVLFTDGYWNGDPPANTSIEDEDSDTYFDSVADIAKYYYDKDLSSLNNNVVGNIFDPVDYQHMVTYTVAFGVSGNLTDTDGDGWPGNAPGLSENDDWGSPFISDSPGKIDDLWHAAYNSRGKFISARTPQELSDGLGDALSNIGDRRGSVAAVAFNTSSLSVSSKVFLTEFKSADGQWNGDILSFSVDSTTGNVGDGDDWSASEQLDAKTFTDRKIFTYNEADNEGVLFSWNKLSNTQKNDLKRNPDNSGSSNTKGEARTNYLRGDKTNEELEGGGTNGSYTFRRRNHLLGDIVHSAPDYIGKPKQTWLNTAPFPTGTSNYQAFKNGDAGSRDPVIYVGSNDGMLHGFKASNGEEVLAYIPSFLFSSASATSGLHYLTDPSYTHRYYMDMPLTIADAYFGSTPAWHTVLIGGGRAGSRGIFALDITDPSDFVITDAAAQKLVMWEFDSTDDADLGFTYSKPTITLMNNGRWAAIFGNGYNSTGSGEASLFIVFLDGGTSGIWTEGTDYIKISTGVGSLTSGACGSSCNGLSTPELVDMTDDEVVDRIYAGDLHGNMWVFDVSTSDVSTWDVANKSGSTAVPLFTATYHETSGGTPSQISTNAQPITSKPILVKHPDKLGGAPDVLVFFGTGQYLVEGDITTTDTQSFYGVWDNSADSLTSALTPTDLVEQEFLSGTFTNNSQDVTNQIRVLSDNDVDYASGKKGWFINLTLESGERLVVDPDIYLDIVSFNTWIPETNPCDPGGHSFKMYVKQINGGGTDTAIFDFDGDGDVDSDDLVTDASGNTYAPNGELFDNGFVSSSSFLDEFQYDVGTKPDGENVSGKDIYKTKMKAKPTGGRRLSWQELRD